MKSRSGLFALPVIALLLFLAACGGAAPATEAPLFEMATEAPAVMDPFSQEGVPAERSDVEEPSVDQAQAPVPMPTAAAFEVANDSGDLTVIERSNRMIIKNADVRLMVRDTDVAIDRATQIVGDAGGYIVSSRVWYQDYYGNNLKYAAITIGVLLLVLRALLTREGRTPSEDVQA